MLGLTAMCLRKHERAAEAFGRVVKTDGRAPNFTWAWANLAQAHFKLQRFEPALAALAKARERKPNEVTLRAMQAHYLAHLGRKAEATRALNELHQALLRSNTNAQRSRIAALESLGRLREAMDAARQLCEIDENHGGLSDVRYGPRRVRCLRGLGKNERARGIATEVTAKVKTCEREERLGLAYLCAVAGDRKRAKSLLDAWDYPWHPNDLHERARVHAVLRDEKAALDWLERAAKKGLRRSARLPVDPAFSALATDPRCRALLKRILFE